MSQARASRAYEVSHIATLGHVGDALDLPSRLSHKSLTTELPNSTIDSQQQRYATCLRHSACGTWLLCGCNDGTVIVWDAVTLTVALVLAAHDGPVVALAELAAESAGSDPLVVTAGADSAIRVWSIVTAQLLRTLYAQSLPLCIVASTSTVRACKVRLVVVGCVAHAPIVFNADTGTASMLPCEVDGDDAIGYAEDTETDDEADNGIAVESGANDSVVQQRHRFVGSCSVWCSAGGRTVAGSDDAGLERLSAVRLLVGTPDGDVRAFLVAASGSGAPLIERDGRLDTPRSTDEGAAAVAPLESVKAVRLLSDHDPAETKLLVVRFDGRASVVVVDPSSALAGAPLRSVPLPGTGPGEPSWRDVDVRADGGVIAAAERPVRVVQTAPLSSQPTHRLRVALWEALPDSLLNVPAAESTALQPKMDRAAGALRGSHVGSTSGYRSLPRSVLQLAAESAADGLMAIAHHAIHDTLAFATRSGRVLHAHRALPQTWHVWAPLLRVPELMRNRPYEYDEARDALAFRACAEDGDGGGSTLGAYEANDGKGGAESGIGEAVTDKSEPHMDVVVDSTGAGDAVEAEASPHSSSIVTCEDGDLSSSAVAGGTVLDVGGAEADYGTHSQHDVDITLDDADSGGVLTADEASPPSCLDVIDVFGDGHRVGVGHVSRASDSAARVAAGQMAAMRRRAAATTVDDAGNLLVPVGTFTPFALPSSAGTAAVAADGSVSVLLTTTAYLLGDCTRPSKSVHIPATMQAEDAVAPVADGSVGDDDPATAASAGAVVHGLIADGVAGIVSITQRDVPIYWLSDE